MDNLTLLIDPETRDLVFDVDGNFTTICDTDAIVQNVRHTLLTWKAEFFADLTHGTEYERIAGKNQNEIDRNEIEEIIREAIFQETNVSRIDELNVTCNGRSVTAAFVATLANGETIAWEVTV